MIERMKYLLLLIPLLLTGCMDEAGRGRINVAWAERGVLYVADQNIGAILALAKNESGRLLARTQTPVRTTVLDLQLDKAKERLWVLRANSVDVHDARSLDRQKRIALNFGESVFLHQNAAGVGLYSKSGYLLARIDPSTLTLGPGGKTPTILASN